MAGISRGLVAAAFVGGVLSSPTPSSGAVVVGSDLPAEQLRDIEPSSLSMAVLEDGSFAVGGTRTFVESSGGGYELDIYYFDSAGQEVGRRTSLRSKAYLTGGIGAIGNHYLLTWARQGEDRSHSQFVSREGASLSHAMPWPNSSIAPFQWAYRYGPAPLRRILPVTYRRAGTLRGGSPYFQPTLQVFSPQGRPLGPVLDIVSPQHFVEIDDIAMNGRGRFVVLSNQFSSNLLSHREARRGFQIFGDSGRPRSPFVTSNVGTSGASSGEFAVAITESGELMITWVANTESGLRLALRKYDRAGTPTSEELTFATAIEPSEPVNREVHALTGGDFALLWAISSPGSQASVVIGKLRSRTMELEPPVVLTSDTLQSAPRMAINAAGVGVVNWTTFDETGHFVGHLQLVRFQ